MSFKFACSHCGQHLSAELSEIGIVTSCPTCSEQIQVPPLSGGGNPPRAFIKLTGTLATRSARISFILLALLLVGGVIWIARPLARRPEAAPQPDSPVPETTEVSSKNDGTLVVKGLFVRMDGEEAIKSITAAAEGNIGTRPTSDPGSKGVDLLFHDPRWKSDVKQYAGGIHVDAKEGFVREFYFMGPLSDFLFGTKDLTAEEFAQKFVDAYNIPSLHVVNFQGKQEWRYESPHGWSLAITRQKQVNVWITTPTSFD